MKPFKDTKAFKIIAGLIRETAQTVPVLGTIITVMKADTKDNPKGEVNLQAWDVYRLVIGGGIGYALYKGLLSMDEITYIMGFIGI